MRMRLENIIQEWCNEAEKPAFIVKDRYALENTLKLYTQYPGYFIGAKGVLVEKYRELLKKIGYEKVEFVEIKEAFTPGNDYDDIVAKRVEAFFELEMM